MGKKHGYSVDFHDLSPDVLRKVTIVNAAANGLCESDIPAPRFLIGDWQQLRIGLAKTKQTYNVVLAAEAVYNADAYAELTALLEQCLAEDGVALFAGKRFYFGCGGGTASFAAFVRDHGFTAQVEQVIEDRRSNVREIVRITRKSADDSENAKRRRSEA